ncbi:ABC transporter ATP-binding protein [Nakamurella antarctica]|uniref:ABC transporter ATP-binding protein n=1 Tax=Nakamurella antarctica TaxID=1902245 RepID=A0A3G8ZWH5_9ACTN|nr:ABC transporter ATP-binding protein [Nakamurella antarctica]AZI58031.1 ABC transporter ATP-binding protein [Nakamurella antarctica]
MTKAQPPRFSGPILTVRDLRVSAGGSELVHGVNLEVWPGERVGIIGASGSGKTLTCMAIAGLLSDGLRATGSIRLAGIDKDLIGAKESALARIRGLRTGMVFQEPMTALNPTMKIVSQVAEVMWQHARHSKRDAKRIAVELLAATGLPDPERVAKSYPHQLSGGQRQRVVLAIALANSPDLLICDEPTTALDVTVQAKVLGLIDEKVAQVGAALLFISHDLAVLAQVCDRVLVMFDGSVVEEGDVATVLTKPVHEHTISLLRDAELTGAP